MNRYLVMVMRTPAFDDALIGPHRAFIDTLRAKGQLEMSGAFGDRSGGAYLLRAESLEEAQAMADADPLIVAKSSVVTVYEWNAA